MRVSLTPLLTVGLTVWVCAACSPVAPWQRGTLAKAQMALEPNHIDAVMRSHAYHSREAASEGGASVGGGCGCY